MILGSCANCHRDILAHEPYYQKHGQAFCEKCYFKRAGYHHKPSLTDRDIAVTAILHHIISDSEDLALTQAPEGQAYASWVRLLELRIQRLIREIEFGTVEDWARSIQEGSQ